MLASLKRLLSSTNRKRNRLARQAQPWSAGPLEPRHMLSGISVLAGGTTGDETIRLFADNDLVGTYSNLGSGADSGQFVRLDADTGNSTPSQIRIEFINDVYEPDQNIDRNVRVDRIEVDGVVYQTESPEVFSTGTWLAEDGIVPGNRESEYLHADGYLQYNIDSNPTGSVIVITADGSTGNENMALQINGETVADWDVSSATQTYSFVAAETVSPDQVRIAFTNDRYEPDAGIDYNLRVDNIRIDGITYETEDPSVFSTGTWLPDDGIVPGNRQNETLHTDGYFQFGSGVNAGFVGLAATQVTVNEADGTVQIGIDRFGGSDGTASVFYQTFGVEAEAGSDFVGTDSGQVNFADGQTSATITVGLIDDNQSEAAETFSVSLFRSEGAELAEPRTALVTIVDDESGQGLVAHWRLDETAIGQNVADSSGNGNSGTHTNIASPAGPIPDGVDFDSANVGALEFDGANDFVSIAADPTLDLSSGQFTQSVWIRPTETGRRFQGVLGFQGTEGVTGRYPGIWVEDDTEIHAGFGDGSNWNNLTTGDVLTLDEWNHVATTFDGTTYRVYANGNEVFATDQFAGRTPVDVTQVNIGRVDNHFDGAIDDVRIYNRALTASEVGVLIDGADVPSVPLENGQFVTNQLAAGFDTPIEVEQLADGRLLVAEQDGTVRLVNLDGTTQSTPVLDIRSIVNSGTKDRGMIGFAVHPDFENNPYIYASYTYDPPEITGGGLGGVDGNGSRVSRISRFTVTNNNGVLTAAPSTNVVLVGNNSTFDNIGNPDARVGLDGPHSCVDASGNPIEDCIPADETSHTIGELEFGPDGMLYAASGDGGSFGRVDPINLRALDVDSLAGKILRIDPITGEAPSDNPLFTGDPDANESKVFAYGLRNPFRFAVGGTASNPEIFVGDVGWTQWEEVNRGSGGENFGWPAFEGGNGESLQTGRYRDLAEVQAYYATNPDVTAPMWARLHSEGARAIVMGDFVGNQTASLAGTLLFTDIGDQILRAATFDENGAFEGVEVVSGNVGFIVDMHTGVDGFTYYVDITGNIGRLNFQTA